MALVYKLRVYKLSAKLKFFAIVFSVLLLQACSGMPTAQKSNKAELVSGSMPAIAADELLLDTANNYPGLIMLYKKKLNQSDSLAESDQYRLKLAESYLNSGDADSAIFYIDPVIYAERDTYELFLLKSKALLMKEDYKGALRTATTARGYGKNNSTVNNLLGLSSVGTGAYDKARKYFINARLMMMDDAVIQNNLAMLDIIEGKYGDAVQRLMSLYSIGQMDDKIKANLTLALAKSGRYQEFKTIHGPGRTEEEYVAIYTGLAGTKSSVFNNKQ